MNDDKKNDNPASGDQNPANPEEGKVDYKAELEKAKKEAEEKAKELSQAQHVIEKLKKDKKENKDKDDDDNGGTIIDAEEIINKVREEADKKIEQFKIEQSKDVIEEAIKAASNDPAEQELIRFRYENSIVKSGFSRSAILEDIQNAKVLANKPKFEKIMGEVKQTQVSHATRSGVSAGSQVVEPTEADLSDGEKSWVNQMVAKGFKREEVVKQLLANKKPSY